MVMLVLLKIVTDLSLYYAFFGTIAACFGADGGKMLTSLVLSAAVFCLSYLGRKSAPVRFCPLVLLALCFLWPEATLADRLLSLPPAAYVTFLVWQKRYEPDWSQQAEQFPIIWKVFLVFTLLVFLVGKGAAMAQVGFPFGITMLLCSVFLLRALRHDLTVACRPSYQIVNFLLLLVVGLCAFGLSSPQFLGACRDILGFFYRQVIAPVLIAFSYLFMGLMQLLIWLFSQLGLHRQEAQEESQVIGDGGLDPLLTLRQTASLPQWLTYLAIALGTLVTIWVLFRIFRALAARGSGRADRAQPTHSRQSLSPRASDTEKMPLNSPVAHVRAQYRKFLKLARNYSLGPEPGETSLDVEKKCRGAFDRTALSQLRQLYLLARYRNTADRQQVQAAKKLYAKLKDSLQDPGKS